MVRIKGFTLIELLIVVAIIGILASMAMVNFLQAQVRAKVVRAKADITTITSALELYAIDTNHYPPQDPTLTNPSGGNTPYWKRLLPLTTPIDYISSAPIDIMNKDGDPVDGSFPSIYDYAVEDKWADEDWNDPRYLSLIYYQSTYMLTGSGPDGANSLTATLWHYPYDPTNGTISKGQIIRLGPGGRLYPN
jgi:general secretion pathway protein G